MYMAVCLLRLCTDAAFVSSKTLSTHAVFVFLLGQDYSDPPISRYNPINCKFNYHMSIVLTFCVEAQVAIIRRCYCRYYRHQYHPRLLGRGQVSVELTRSTRWRSVNSRRVLTEKRLFVLVPDQRWHVLQRMRGTANIRRPIWRSFQP